MSAETDELVKEMSARTKAIAFYLRKLSAIEEKVDKILTKSNQPKPYIERGCRG